MARKQQATEGTKVCALIVAEALPVVQLAKGDVAPPFRFEDETAAPIGVVSAEALYIGFARVLVEFDSRFLARRRAPFAVFVVVLGAFCRAFAADVSRELGEVAVMRRVARHRVQRRRADVGAVEVDERTRRHFAAMTDVMARAVLASVNALFESFNRGMRFLFVHFHSVLPPA